MNMQRRYEEEKWVIHYSSNHQMLLVGEGDFSFSLSLASAFGSASNICATSLDSYDDLIKKYKRAKSNLKNLEKLGATLLHKVDATTMKFHTDLMKRKFDRIIFNFPHAGFYGKEDNAHLIEMHRTLVQDFFWNARSMLFANGEVHINHKTKAPFCHWNLEELACRNSLVLIECVDFKREDYPGYCNKRGGGSRCDDAFPLGKCSTYKFTFCHGAKEKRHASTRLGSIWKTPCKFQNITMQRQLQPTFSDFNYPLRNLIMNHMPLHVGQASSTPETNHYSRGFHTDLNGIVQTYGLNCYDMAHSLPERMYSDFDVGYHVDLQRQARGNMHYPLEVVRISNCYDTAHSLSERMYSGFDVGYHVDLQRQDHGHMNDPCEVLRINNLRSHYTG